MNLKIRSKEFYTRQNKELKRYFHKNKKILHIFTNETKVLNIFDEKNIDLLVLDKDSNDLNKLSSIENELYDLIIITDLFEISENIYELLHLINSKLVSNGKVLISTINPKWKYIINFFEKLKLKNSIRKSSNTKLKKIVSLGRSCGFELNYFYTKQIFPFKVFGIGSYLNKALELILFKFNLGIKSYILFSKISNYNNELSKTIIVPAKNESKNLDLLFGDFPKISSLSEVILICGSSTDNTFEEAVRVSKKYKDLKIKVIQQKSDGKAGAVFEALNYSFGDLIAILDSDMSVDPNTLLSFFEIIEGGQSDFVNGTRFIYPIEDKSMRFQNKIGNFIFRFLVSIVIQNKLSDTLCGTKVFRKSHIEKILEWRKDLNYLDPFGDFDFLFSAAYCGEKIVEYPVHYKARVYGETQIRRYRDGFKLIIYFLKSFSRFNSSLN